MGYQGTIPGTPPTPLRRIPNRAADLVPEAAKVMVTEATAYMQEQVKANTPVSDPPLVAGYQHIPGGDGVHMRDEVHSSELISLMDVYEKKVGSDKIYAPYVEEGTGLYGPKHAKYLIVPLTPGGWLAWPGFDGEMHLARMVWHPGSPGQHMFLIGGELTELSMPELVINGNRVLSDGMR